MFGGGKSKCAMCGVTVGSLDRVKLTDDTICTFCFEKCGFENTPGEVAKASKYSLEEMKAKKIAANPHLAQTSTKILDDDSTLDDLPPMEDYDDEYEDGDGYEEGEYEEGEYEEGEYEEGEYDAEGYEDGAYYDDQGEYAGNEEYYDETGEYYDESGEYYDESHSEVVQPESQTEYCEGEECEEQPQYAEEVYYEEQPEEQAYVAEEPYYEEQPEEQAYVAEEPYYEEQPEEQAYVAEEPYYEEPVVEEVVVQQVVQEVPKPVAPVKKIVKVVAKPQVVEKPVPQPIPKPVPSPVPQPVKKVVAVEKTIPKPVKVVEVASKPAPPKAVVAKPVPPKVVAKPEPPKVVAKPVPKVVEVTPKVEVPVVVAKPVVKKPKATLDIKGFDFAEIEDYYNSNEGDNIEVFVKILDSIEEHLKNNVDNIEEVNGIVESLERATAHFKSQVGGYEISLNKTKVDLIRQDLKIKINAKNGLIDLIEDTLYQLRKKTFQLTGERPTRKKLIKPPKEEKGVVIVHKDTEFDFEVIDAYCANKEDNLQKFVNILGGLDSYLQTDVDSVTQIDEIIYSLENAVDYFIDQLLEYNGKRDKTDSDLVKDVLTAKISTRQSLVVLVKEYLSKLNEKMRLEGKAIVIQTQSGGFHVVTDQEKDQILDLIEKNNDVIPVDNKNVSKNDIGQMVNMIETLYSQMNANQELKDGENQTVEFKISLKKHIAADMTATEEFEVTATKNNSKRNENHEKENLVKKLDEMISSIKSAK